MKKELENIEDELIKKYLEDNFKGNNFHFEKTFMEGVKVTEDGSEDYVTIVNMFNDLVIYYNDEKLRTVYLGKDRFTNEDAWIVGSAFLDK